MFGLVEAFDAVVSAAVVACAAVCVFSVKALSWPLGETYSSSAVCICSADTVSSLVVSTVVLVAIARRRACSFG